MKVTLNDDVEVAHAWVDDDGKVRNYVFTAKKNEVVDSESLSFGDPERLLSRLVKLGYASSV